MGLFLWLNEVPVIALSIPLITTFLFVLNRFVCPYLQSRAVREVEWEQNGSHRIKLLYLPSPMFRYNNPENLLYDKWAPVSAGARSSYIRDHTLICHSAGHLQYSVTQNSLDHSTVLSRLFLSKLINLGAERATSWQSLIQIWIIHDGEYEASAELCVKIGPCGRCTRSRDVIFIPNLKPEVPGLWPLSGGS